jgi:hypothetical protein
VYACKAIVPPLVANLLSSFSLSAVLMDGTTNRMRLASFLSLRVFRSCACSFFMTSACLAAAVCLFAITVADWVMFRAITLSNTAAKPAASPSDWMEPSSSPLSGSFSSLARGAVLPDVKPSCSRFRFEPDSGAGILRDGASFCGGPRDAI